MNRHDGPEGGRVRWHRGAILALALTIAACGDSPLAPDVGVGSRVVLDRDVVVAESHQQTIVFTARVLDAQGEELHDVPLEWLVEDPGVLESLTDGSFRTLSDGESDIVVRIPRSYPSVSPGGYFANTPTARANVQVQQVARSLVFTEAGAPSTEGDPEDSVLEVLDIWAANDTVRLAVSPADAEGQIVEGLAVSDLVWSSADEEVSLVSAQGAVQPVGDGETTIRVAGDSLTGEFVVRVRTKQRISTCATMEGQSEAGASACSSLEVTFVRGSAES